MALSTKSRNGFTLIEALLSMTVLILLGIGSVAANRLTTASVTINQLRSKANVLAEEGMEALMSVRANNFTAISQGTYHPIFDGTKWTLAPGEETLGQFTRSIVITSVMRNLVCFSAVCDIVSQGGITDPGSFMGDVYVRWMQQGSNAEIKLSTLITYWR